MRPPPTAKTPRMRAMARLIPPRTKPMPKNMNPGTSCPRVSKLAFSPASKAVTKSVEMLARMSARTKAVPMSIAPIAVMGPQR